MKSILAAVVGDRPASPLSRNWTTPSPVIPSSRTGHFPPFHYFMLFFFYVSPRNAPSAGCRGADSPTATQRERGVAPALATGRQQRLQGDGVIRFPFYCDLPACHCGHCRTPVHLARAMSQQRQQRQQSPCVVAPAKPPAMCCPAHGPSYGPSHGPSRRARPAGHTVGSRPFQF